MIENKKYIETVIKECDTGFLSTLNLDGIPETRALANWLNQNDTNINSLYFTTNVNTPKIDQIKKNNKSSIYYYLIENMQNLTIFGTTEVVNDKALKDKFWRDEFLQYYPDGKDGKFYGIIKFTPKSYKYYKCDGKEFKKIEGKF